MKYLLKLFVRYWNFSMQRCNVTVRKVKIKLENKLGGKFEWTKNAKFSIKLLDFCLLLCWLVYKKGKKCKFCSQHFQIDIYYSYWLYNQGSFTSDFRRRASLAFSDFGLELWYLIFGTSKSEWDGLSNLEVSGRPSLTLLECFRCLGGK